MLKILVVGSGGFIGAASRYVLAIFINKLYSGNFPTSTLIINVLGSFLIGFLTQLFAGNYPDNKNMMIFLTTGVLGGFTTFSTFSLETINLFQNGNTLQAALNMFLSIVFCLTGTFLGKLLANIFVS